MSNKNYTEAEPFIRAVAAFLAPVIPQKVKQKLPWDDLEKTFLEHIKRIKERQAGQPKA